MFDVQIPSFCVVRNSVFKSYATLIQDIISTLSDSHLAKMDVS